jgi:uncharacterized protein (TIGR00296 family)
MISEKEAEQLVRLARTAVQKYLEESVFISSNNCKTLSQKMGVFVTLNHLNSKNEKSLRGCIGFPLPEKELHQAVVEAAIAAATQDPRFPPIDRTELGNIIFEISLLTTPEEIKVQNPKDYPNQIKIGKDGLILKWRHGSGLLLPQVPVELKWDVDEYLANICYKAGALPDTWLMPESKLYKFQALVYKESEPCGKVLLAAA